MRKHLPIIFLSACLLFACSLSGVNSYNISQVNHTNASTGVADSLNKRFQLSGTVYGVNFSVAGKLAFFMNDGTGAIKVYANQNYGYSPMQGDYVVVIGSL